MNSDTLQGAWKQLRGNVKEAFGKLTDDDLMQADGNADKILGALQSRYGYTKEQAQNEWDKFSAKHTTSADETQSDLDAAGDHIKAAANHVKDASQRA